jgi:ribosomal-protein-alanine N-acetyltransferase
MSNDSKTVTLADNQYSFRQISPADISELHELDALCFSPEKAFTEGYFGILFQFDKAFGWCLQQEEQISAFILYTAKQNNANIATIDVHPEARRQGLGKKLMIMTEDILRDEDFRSISLQVEHDNMAAIQLYKKMNFDSVKILPGFYSGSDGIQMKKNLL